MSAFDRFQPPGSRDEPHISAYCAWCGGEIYVGDDVTSVYDPEPDLVHAACEHAWIASNVVHDRGVAGENGEVT